MHHRHGDFGRRLSVAERLEIRRLVRSGEPYRVAAAAVGTTPKTIGLLMRETGGLPPRAVTRSALRLSAASAKKSAARWARVGRSDRSPEGSAGRPPPSRARSPGTAAGAGTGRGGRRPALANGPLDPDSPS